MRKTEAKNMQRRAFDAAVKTKKNTHGIDPSAFKSTDQLSMKKRELAQEKIDIEARLSVVNFNIAAARNRRRSDTHYATLNRLLEQREKLVSEKMKIDQSLIEMKRISLTLREREQSAIGEAFLECARELLAPPVFHRVLNAAIHRAGEIDTPETQRTPARMATDGKG